MQEGVIHKYSTFNCKGGYLYENDKTVQCHPHKTPLNIEKGIEISCNTYFCNAFERYFRNFRTPSLGYKNWEEHVKSFGVGHYMNNDFITGSPGKIPKASYYNNMYRGSWNANTIISMSIGQGELLMTPIQMANMTAILANRGYYFTPHIIKQIEGKELDSTFLIKRYCSIEEKYFEPIINGMKQVVHGNEGHKALNSR